MKPLTRALIWASILWIAIGTAILVVPGVDKGTERLENAVSRYYDREAGVVCWIYARSDKGGISCLPISQTALEP